MKEKQKTVLLGVVFLSLIPYVKYVIFQDNFEKFYMAVGLELGVIFLIYLSPFIIINIIDLDEDKRKNEILSTSYESFKNLENSIRFLKNLTETEAQKTRIEIKKMNERLAKMEVHKEDLSPDVPPRIETNTEVIDQLIC
jgi:hypothetical protein